MEITPLPENVSAAELSALLNIANEKPYGIIYRATNKITKMVYIGATTGSIPDRRKIHVRDAKRRKPNYFGEALSKYGSQGFDWDEIGRANSREELDALEIYWIIFYDSTNKERGYNTESGGRRPGTMVEETRLKISETKKEKYASGEIVNSLINKKMSDSEKNHLRKKAKERLGSKKKNLNHSNIGTHNSPKTEFPSVKIQCVETGEVYNTMTEAAKKT